MRKSISLKGLTYQRLKDHCDAIGKPVSYWIEEAIADVLKQRPPELSRYARKCKSRAEGKRGARIISKKTMAPPRRSSRAALTPRHIKALDWMAKNRGTPWWSVEGHNLNLAQSLTHMGYAEMMIEGDLRKVRITEEGVACARRHLSKGA